MFQLCGICQVQNGTNNVVLDMNVKTQNCTAPDTCYTAEPKAVLQDGENNVYRQFFVCTAQMNMTLPQIAEECKSVVRAPPPTDVPAPVIP